MCSHRSDDGIYYEREDLKILRIAKEFARYGLEPRHMRMYENLTGREVMAFEQIILPALKSKDQEARRRALDTLLQLVNLSRELKDLLLKNRVKQYYQQAGSILRRNLDFWVPVPLTPCHTRSPHGFTSKRSFPGTEVVSGRGA